MKAYVVTTGVVFALLIVAHIWRAAVEGAGLAKEPAFIISTLIAAALCVWAWRVFRRLPRL